MKVAQQASIKFITQEPLGALKRPRMRYVYEIDM